MVADKEPEDRLAWIRIQGFRSLQDVTLDLNGLSVLIGDNSSGKSAIIEAIETLRYFGQSGASVVDYFEQHAAAVRTDRSKFEISLAIESKEPDAAPPIRYSFALVNKDGKIGVAKENLEVGLENGPTTPAQVLRRDFGEAVLFDQSRQQLVPVGHSPAFLLLTQVANAPRLQGPGSLQQRAIDRLARVLRGIEVHVPFEVLPTWVSRGLARKSASREASLVQPAPRLELLATNLANAFATLREYGEEHWRETLALVRLGLGNDIDTVAVRADAAGGQHALSIRYQSIGAFVPAAGLSDGTLAYLAFVALTRLPSDRHLLAFDEPELHLHPGLLVRVLSMFETIARSSPVVLATHSDRLLDALQEPAASIVVCELDENRATRLVRPDAEMLSRWRKEYRGFGDIRATGLQDAVMPPRKDAP